QVIHFTRANLERDRTELSTICHNANLQRTGVQIRPQAPAQTLAIVRVEDALLIRGDRAYSLGQLDLVEVLVSLQQLNGFDRRIPIGVVAFIQQWPYVAFSLRVGEQANGQGTIYPTCLICDV